MILDILLDTVLDGLKLLPFLFLTYLLMEALEHRTGGHARNRIRTAGKTGPIWGALLGVVPQCGFSAAASSLYAGRVITVGTLLAIYLSTSDEMLPILISEAVPFGTIAKLLLAKVAIAMVSGLVIEFVYVSVMKKKEKEMDIHVVCEEEHCHCEDGIFVSAVKHTIKIFFYIFLISLALNAVIGVVGEDNLAGLFSGIPVVGELIAALVGLIPNCASSVVITQLYLDGIINSGAMMAGLLVNAGVGLLVLFRLNRSVKQNAGIVAVLYGLGVFWGIIIELLGIVF
ncbi:MAG: putative manganese transporter [Roseburia sp.]